LAEKKRATDKDYRENQAYSQKKWKEKHPGYWKKYRADHPEYTKRNRDLQKGRNEKRKRRLNLPDFVISEIAKMEKTGTKCDIISGYYKLIPIENAKIANMEEIVVKIDIISGC
jgi:hypothetical protein